MLHEFLNLHREEIIARTRQKVAARAGPPATGAELENGVPLFLEQLVETLRREKQTSARPTSTEMVESALLHGGELRKAGFTLAQVVHGYGDVCQAVTGLAMELEIGISPDEFKTLNRCLEEAIAQAVTEFARQGDIAVSDRGTERQGFFVHELRNLLGNALLALEVLKTGRVGIGGSTGAVLERNLIALRDLFRPFEQRSTDRSGLGLGLAIARASVAANEGEIRVRSLPGKGCIFTVDLPLVGGTATATGELAAVRRG